MEILVTGCYGFAVDYYELDWTYGTGMVFGKLMGILFLVARCNRFAVNWYDGHWTYGKFGYVCDMQSTT